MADEVATKKARAPKAKAEKPEAAGAGGRKVSPETEELMAKLYKLACRKNGITNIEAASEMGVNTLRASSVGRHLIKQGRIDLIKDDNGRVTYQKAA